MLNPTPAKRRDAIQIYQEHLDVLSGNLMRNDFANFITRINIPHSITNLSGEILCHTEADAKDLFDEVHQTMKRDAITDFIRLAVEAEYISDTVIIGTHKTEMLRGATRALLPYLNRIRLEQSPDTVWRETHCSNGIRLRSDKFGLIDTSVEHGPPPPLPAVVERTKAT